MHLVGFTLVCCLLFIVTVNFIRMKQSMKPGDDAGENLTNALPSPQNGRQDDKIKTIQRKESTIPTEELVC
ncbi:hypothetical protein [Chitinophaga caeni]|uniref:hypothetical protein n=1 Tax=Chitinophaga caeni TaxID=2029983 RepID=UPI0012FE09CB|nr:hypothetical protein [Chitinophaga caeni]